MRFALEHRKHGGRMLNGAAEAEPRSQGDAARHGGGRIGEVHDDQPEAAAFDEQVGRFERFLRISRAAHPEQAGEIDAGGGRRAGVEGAGAIDQRANLFARGGLGEQRNQKRCAAARGGAADFGEAAAR